MIGTNCELREQRDKLASKLTEMKDKIEILHAEISREGASKKRVYLYMSLSYDNILVSLLPKSKP